ncbi:MAG: DUF3303 family protein [Asgard group archaeon]
MPRFYVKWEIDRTKIPLDPAERVKLWMSMLEMVKDGLNTGVIKDWGMFSGGTGGYSVGEFKTEAEHFAYLLRWMPYINFEVQPILTVDQTIEAIKKAVAAAQSK